MRSREPLNSTVELVTCRQNGQIDGVILSSMRALAFSGLDAAKIGMAARYTKPGARGPLIYLAHVTAELC